MIHQSRKTALPLIDERLRMPMARRPDILTTFSEEGRIEILSQCRKKRYKARQVIWRAGDKAQFIAFIAQGTAISLYHARNGRVGATGLWTTGDILGGSSIFRPRERQTTVKCLEPVVIHCLDLQKASELFYVHPDISRSIIDALSARLRWSNHLTQMLQTLSAFERVAAVLLSLSERFGNETNCGIEINLVLSQEDFAALVGITRQFFSITLHELEKDGVICLKRRTIIITDLNRLIRMVPSI